MKLKYICISACVLASLSFFGIPQALAENLESSSYRIQFGNFNITAGEKSSSSYNVTDTVGQTGAGPYGQYGVSGYFVGSGFQYIYQIDQFSFRISKLNISLGALSPAVHNTDAHNIAVTTRGAGGYRIYAYEGHPLRHQNGSDFIPNTTCDSGSCTTTTAAAWINQNIAGFGYNMTGNDIPTDFTNSTYYRPFANTAAAEPMQIVMSSVNTALNRTATVTYKAGVTGNQAAGDYSTYVVFVAVPGY